MGKFISQFDAYRRPKIDGVKYCKDRSFWGKHGKEKAEKYVETIKDKFSRRYPPVIQKVYIGWRLGYVYRVCIPKKI